jgi:hypothetical protein
MQQHPLELEIREHLSAYLAGEISLREFEDWFFQKTWNADSVDDPALVDLIYQIKLNWAEFTNDDWSEEELRAMLEPLARQFTVSPPSTQIVPSTSSKNDIVSRTIIYPGQFAGIKFVVEYV